MTLQRKTPLRKSRPKTTKLRQAAKGRECQIRIPGICNRDPETVVLCHLPGAGMGMKSHDIHGAYGCSRCHDVVDGRNPIIPAFQARLYLLEGVIRTQKILIEEGLL